ncbi:hypothetical protein LguiB_007814 [Lonicera macranthoides]
MEKQRGHVLVLTYPAQGHINPLLQFAKRLSSKGLKTTFATTPYTLSSVTASGVGLHPISDGYDGGGFIQAPSLESYLASFKAAGTATLTELILKFKDTDWPVNCLVYDSLLPWGIDVARGMGIYGAVFLTNSASVCSMYWHAREGGLSLPVKKGPVVLPGLPELRLSEMPSFVAEYVEQSPYLAAIMDKFAILDQIDWVFINTFEELESELAKAMSGLWPLTMVGPMVPSSYLDNQIKGDTDYGASLWKPIGEESSKWLESKQPKSVIYVSFGSMANIAPEQVEEIAWGLKATKKHFLWVIKDSEKHKLPNKFINSMEENGSVVNWCNQLEVLAHQAVGCFVTHCGWNSTLEGLSLGVPMVAMAQWSDQPTNAKFVEEVWGVGVRAKKDEGGVVRRAEVKRCINEVMEGERSEEMRRNGCNWRENAKRAVSRGGSSDYHIDKFVEVILKGKGKQN